MYTSLSGRADVSRCIIPPKLHPDNNIGVQRTNDVGASVILDYLSFTAPCVESLSFVASDFDGIGGDCQSISFVLSYLQSELGQFIDRSGGIYGYTSSAIIPGGGLCAWTPSDPARGVFVSLPSGALSEYGKDALDLVVNLGAVERVTRLDLAFDDFSGFLNIDTILNHLQSGAVVGRFRQYRPFSGVVAIGGCSVVSTVYVGSRQSETMLRFYDKALEQSSKGWDINNHWVRCEVELKGARAALMCRRLLDLWDKDNFYYTLRLREYLRGIIDFKEQNLTDSNKRRWDTVDWWEKFLDVAGELYLSIPAKVRTLAQVRDWFIRSIAPMLAVLMTADDVSDNWSWLSDSLIDGQRRWSRRHKRYVGDKAGDFSGGGQ